MEIDAGTVLFIAGIAMIVGMVAMLAISIWRGDAEKTILFGAALSIGPLGNLAVVIGATLAVLFIIQRDYRKTGFVILGMFVGLMMWVLIAICLGAGLL